MIFAKTIFIMKTSKTFTLLIVATLLATNICAQPVTLDPTFGENGMTVIPVEGEIQPVYGGFVERGDYSITTSSLTRCSHRTYAVLLILKNIL